MQGHEAQSTLDAQMEPVVVNEFTQDASDMKGIAHKFACWRGLGQENCPSVKLLHTNHRWYRAHNWELQRTTFWGKDHCIHTGTGLDATQESLSPSSRTLLSSVSIELI